MTLKDALSRGTTDVPRRDPLHGCRTASAISKSGRWLYTVTQDPLGHREVGVVRVTDGQPQAYHNLVCDERLFHRNLKWEPGTEAVKRFKRQHDL